MQASEQEPTLGSVMKFAGENLGNIHAFNGLPFFSESGRRWIKACSGEELTLQYRPAPDDSFWQSPVIGINMDAYANPSSPLSLPSISSLREDISTYRKSDFSLFFPVIDSSLFEDTIKTVYQSGNSLASPEIISARACVFAFSAMVSIMIRKTKGSAQILEEQYTRESYRLLAPTLNKIVNVEGLQTLVILGICSQAIAGELLVIYNLLTSATRFVYRLKAHIDPTLLYNEPTRSQCHLRNLFWVTYLCDKAITLGTGLPPMLADSNCDLILPTKPSSTVEGLQWSGNPCPGSFFHTAIRLSILHARIYQELYSPISLRQSNANLLKSIRDLDHEVHEWSESIPSNIRPSMLPKNQAPESVDMRTTVFQLQYHHCMVMIHQASSRCSSWVENQDTRGMYSSLAISVAASRSLLHKFLDYQMELDSHNLLFSLSYVIHAIVILFCNILTKPLDPDNIQDLRLICATPKLLKEVHERSIERNNSTSIDFTEDFGVELRRIAQAAIEKALRDIGRGDEL
ncbi:uncharacterized protein N7483_006836 [Penicillium malachiteum]|uniref:uncharacterized protein n=1 Tax=Penicillium malachiteum TaxID=1324776 RepID=UPI002547D661|nr:uncharacterized protein N7483_006836 [Penicillium malachiteum]KAJ5725479.1 hypothetical protein N7483_006836 [Penicillium malachiteum]